jgi:SNF2 family DNA or RNA helicase
VHFDIPDVAGSERDHDTEDEGPADFDAEEEEAAKAHELTQTSSHHHDSGNHLSQSQTSSSGEYLFVDVPSLSDFERSTYTMVLQPDGLDDNPKTAVSELDSVVVVDSVVADQTVATELDPVVADQATNVVPSQTPPPSLPLPVDADQELQISVIESPLPPDQQAAQFAFKITAEEEAEDRKFDEEMLAHHDQVADSDDEDAGLLQDAELPIEELLARYNYKLDETPYTFGTRGSDTESSADSDDEADRLNIDESVAAASESDSDSGSESDTEQPVGLPFLLRADLRPYQRTGLTWLARLYREKTNAILADEMGLGKTLQTIALLAHLACDQQEWGPHLIIVPTSVILNWEMEFKKFLPGFKVLTYYGSQQERKERRKGWFAPHAFQVCITSYQIAIADQAIFRRRQWQYLILDEAHNIKNFRSQRWQTLLGFKSERRLLLTGTPLQNNLMELWSLMYFLMPAGLTGAYDGGEFADHKDFSDWFSSECLGVL